nr:ribonuclease H-like domain-containing protein [Tanacetum cinerariifolium]
MTDDEAPTNMAFMAFSDSEEDLNLKFLRSMPSEWNTHVVVWRNKSDLNKMILDDLYNNFKIVKQEVRGTTSTNTSSQNMAFVSSPSPNSTNEVPADFGVSTASS